MRDTLFEDLNHESYLVYEGLSSHGGFLPLEQIMGDDEESLAGLDEILGTWGSGKLMAIELYCSSAESIPTGVDDNYFEDWAERMPLEDISKELKAEMIQHVDAVEVKYESNPEEFERNSFAADLPAVAERMRKRIRNL